MVHFPSLFVGSTFSLVSFLAIHEQLSHRSRLSSKWKLTGTNELPDFLYLLLLEQVYDLVSFVPPSCFLVSCKQRRSSSAYVAL
jgi:hypothetical protein